MQPVDVHKKKTSGRARPPEPRPLVEPWGPPHIFKSDHLDEFFQSPVLLLIRLEQYVDLSPECRSQRSTGKDIHTSQTHPVLNAVQQH
jgi:hypothetical protein